MRQLYRIFVGPKMHEEQARLFIQHVAVQGSDLDSIRAQRFNYGIDFASKQHEIASDGCLTISGGLEIDGS
jgi:hypothetical protein